MRRRLPWFLAAASAACTVGPDYTPPADPAPARWTGAAAPDDGQAGTRIDAAGVERCWQAFGDAVLDDLLARAVAGSRDLRVALARVREARLHAAAAGSARWPRVDAAASYSNSRLSENGFLEGLATGTPGGGAVLPGQQLDLHQVGFDASWELDLFGSVRRGVEAADADAQATALDLRAVQLALCADVVDGYVELRSLQQRSGLAERLVAAHRASVAVLDERVRVGVAAELDLARAQTELAEQQARSAEVTGEIGAVLRRLEVLVGEPPGGLGDRLAAGPMPAAPDVLAIDVPAATLARRPDVGAAERRLAAATARIGVATAELYPRFSLTGAFGLQAQDVADLPSGDSRFWSVGPSVRWPLFDFGRVRRSIAIADARAEAALAAYEGAVLAALGDVEIALVRVARWRRQVAALEAARASARRAAELAAEQYRSGVLEYADLLDVERARDRTEDACALGGAALLHAIVALDKALGGGIGGAAAAAP